MVAGLCPAKDGAEPRPHADKVTTLDKQAYLTRISVFAVARLSKRSYARTTTT
jgi:hypothetical protein